MPRLDHRHTRRHGLDNVQSKGLAIEGRSGHQSKRTEKLQLGCPIEVRKEFRVGQHRARWLSGSASRNVSSPWSMQMTGARNSHFICRMSPVNRALERKMMSGLGCVLSQAINSLSSRAWLPSSPLSIERVISPK